MCVLTQRYAALRCAGRERVETNCSARASPQPPKPHPPRSLPPIPNHVGTHPSPHAARTPAAPPGCTPSARHRLGRLDLGRAFLDARRLAPSGCHSPNVLIATSWLAPRRSSRRRRERGCGGTARGRRRDRGAPPAATAREDRGAGALQQRRIEQRALEGPQDCSRQGMGWSFLGGAAPACLFEWSVWRVFGERAGGRRQRAA